MHQITLCASWRKLHLAHRPDEESAIYYLSSWFEKTFNQQDIEVLAQLISQGVVAYWRPIKNILIVQIPVRATVLSSIRFS